VNVDELSVRIQDKYRVELAGFRRKVFGPEGNTGAHNQDDPDRSIPGLGPVRSLEDRHVGLTVGADVAHLDWFTQTPGMEGSCVTMSIAGHHRVMGTRTSLPTEECDAWMQAVLGVAWSESAYRAGTLSGVAGRLSTVYYRLFLDEEGHPMPKPDSVQDRGLRPIDEL
jgi:hypothetical protein